MQRSVSARVTPLRDFRIFGVRARTMEIESQGPERKASPVLAPGTRTSPSPSQPLAACRAAAVRRRNANARTVDDAPPVPP